MEYTVIRSRRRTFAIQVTTSGVVIRSPLSATKKEIDAFAKKYEAWASKKTDELSRRIAEAEEYPPLTADDVERLAWEAMRAIPERVSRFAKEIGVKYGRITIRKQKTRWGSCSSKGNLSFNCLLMLAPPDVLDSVIVHELCHLKYMDHSDKFYAEVQKFCPDYFAHNAWLKKNGRTLLLRADPAFF